MQINLSPLTFVVVLMLVPSAVYVIDIPCREFVEARQKAAWRAGMNRQKMSLYREAGTSTAEARGDEQRAIVDICDADVARAASLEIFAVERTPGEAVR
ncbi:MAG: hypothetical protein WD294_15800 [Phycisphaeraceae bacterium]